MTDSAANRIQRFALVLPSHPMFPVEGLFFRNSSLRTAHFEQLQPICPVCADPTNQFEARLCIESVGAESDQHIVEGILRCTHSTCLSEFPIIDGIPIIHPQLRTYVTDNFFHIHARQDLTAVTESILGDCCSQGSPLDVTRQHLSCYAWDHYADRDSAEVDTNLGILPGSVSRLLHQGLQADASLDNGPLLDIGCGVGRTTFELASQTQELVLGIDIHFAMLQVAALALRTGVVRYPRRRVGLVYDRREFQIEFPNMDQVDFWACDVTALPFSSGLFGQCTAMNVLDSVASPYAFLNSLMRVMKLGGSALIGSPYDWTASVTPVEAWLGGHSQRGPQRGESSVHVRQLLTPGMHSHAIAGLEIVGELEKAPWTLRLHDRSTMSYQVHLINLRKNGKLN